METSNIHIFSDAWIMFKRCLLISLRHPETLLVSTIVPFLLMYLFGAVFGSIAEIDGFHYIDFIVPGIILQSIAQASQYSAINVASDMSNGIMDRFRSMSVAKSAILIAHTGAGVVRNTISTITIMITALFLGFQPQGGLWEWCLVLVILTFVNITISLLAVLCGLIAKTPEGAVGLILPLFILPFISSGFAPVETMPSSIRWLAQVQPMTPIIDSIRALTLQTSIKDSLWLAFGWCIGITIISFIIALQVYKRKVS